MSSYFQNTPSFPFDKAWKARKDYYEKQQFYAPQSAHKPVVIPKPGFEGIQATGCVEGYAGPDVLSRVGERRLSFDRVAFIERQLADLGTVVRTRDS